MALPFVASTVLLHFRFEDLSSYTSTLWGSSESLSLLFLFFLPAFLAWAVLGLFFREGLLPRRAVSVLLCVLLCVEVPFQMSVYMGSAASSADRQEAVFDLEGEVEEDTLFRVKNAEKEFDVNLLGAIGYPTLNHYTSLTSQSFLFGMKKLGYSSYWMEVNSNGGTALDGCSAWQPVHSLPHGGPAGGERGCLSKRRICHGGGRNFLALRVSCSFFCRFFPVQSS